MEEVEEHPLVTEYDVDIAVPPDGHIMMWPGETGSGVVGGKAIRPLGVVLVNENCADPGLRDAILGHELIHYTQGVSVVGHPDEALQESVDGLKDGVSRVEEELGQQQMEDIFVYHHPRSLAEMTLAARLTVFDGSLPETYTALDARTGPATPGVRALSTVLAAAMTEEEAAQVEDILSPVADRRWRANHLQRDWAEAEVAAYFYSHFERVVTEADEVSARDLYASIYRLQPHYREEDLEGHAAAEGCPVPQYTSHRWNERTLASRYADPVYIQDGLEQAIERYAEHKQAAPEASDREVAGEVIQGYLDRFATIPPYEDLP